VNAILKEFKIETGSTGDSDYHLVLTDDQGKTMIAEIPSPSCVGSGSLFAAKIANARAEFDSQFTVSSSFQTVNIPVQITGVGFFDFFHNQTGVAPNVIELHPVLDIAFNTAPNIPDFTFSMSPASVTLNQGGSTSTLISTKMLNGFSGAILFSPSGLPANISSTVTDSGAGNATLTLSASAGTPPGTYPVSVIGSSAGRSHGIPLTLTVNPAVSGPAVQQWEYKSYTTASEQDLVNQADILGLQSWEMVSVVWNAANSTNTAFFKRQKSNF
jgi:hypothetical protein